MAKAKRHTRGRGRSFSDFVASEPELTVLTDTALRRDEVSKVFEHDPFNFRYKLGPVYDILRYKDPPDKANQDGRTPMAILISGGWGTGKTSAMQWLDCLLRQWNQTGNGIRVHPVWFYPWKYDKKEDVWRGLVSEVILASIKVENATWPRVQAAAKQFVRFLGKSFIGALASIKLTGKVSAAGAEASAGTDLAFLKDILAEYREVAHPENAYLNEFEDSLEQWVTTTLGENERMVIFIDDLDRCLPDIALQVLEALKLYLNIPKLIFVVGVDKAVIETLVVEHYRKLGLVKCREPQETNEARDERLRDEEKARQYLSKMFQVEVELAPTEGQIREFLHRQLNAIPYWTKRLSRDHRRLFSDIVLRLARQNPREVKRLLNSGLMAAAGAEMTRGARAEGALRFEQGLQDFFVRRILQQRYPSIAGMIDTDIGSAFLTDWSDQIIKNKDTGGNDDRSQIPSEQQPPESEGR